MIFGAMVEVARDVENQGIQTTIISKMNRIPGHCRATCKPLITGRRPIGEVTNRFSPTGGMMIATSGGRHHDGARMNAFDTERNGDRGHRQCDNDDQSGGAHELTNDGQSVFATTRNTTGPNPA